MSLPAYLNYWGKACPAQDLDCVSPTWHPAAYHCLDVAAVGVAYARQHPALLELLRDCLCDWDDESILAWLGFFLALHDLGKFSEAFQGQKPDLFHTLRNRYPRQDKAYSLRHDSLGYLFWETTLTDMLLDDGYLDDFFVNDSVDLETFVEGLNPWMRAITGHHGQPPQTVLSDTRSYFVQDDEIAIKDFLSDLSPLFSTQKLRKNIQALDEVNFSQRSQQISWWLAGVTVLADWIGSNTTFFPYQAPTKDLSEYWQSIQRQAEEAIQKTGVLPVKPLAALSFSTLFQEIKTPSPLQQWADNLSLRNEPQLFLLEDVTGAGKTEAALTLIQRLLAIGAGDGFFIGLPTMATANAMYDRIATVYQKLFSHAANLSLAHGKSDLVENFVKSTVLSAAIPENDPKQADETAGAQCSAWLASRSKTALLAPAAVGTIDQALLGALHSKHQSLRLLGLFHKILVVDEVHACDTYMQKILEALLSFHAEAGGSAILLSATLPQTMKSALTRAFAAGRGIDEVSLGQESAYPLVTHWQESLPSGVTTIPLPSRPEVSRQLAITYLDQEDEVLATIANAVAEGQCVCWLRNTVFDALTAYQCLVKIYGSDAITLFHARFAYADRLATEKEILHKFGKNSTAAKRSRQIVIATQVAEQSLDADWDVMLTDLAPIDRLLQRAGRLQRHVRTAAGNPKKEPGANDERPMPCLYVFAPTWTENPAENWFQASFPKAANVYPEHDKLWRSAELLQRGEIHLPDMAREWIEHVFSESAVCPDGLQRHAAEAEGLAYSALSYAKQHTLPREQGYQRGDNGNWWGEAQSPSRLGEPTKEIVLARWQAGQLNLWHKEETWESSTLRLPCRQIDAALPPNPAQATAYTVLQATLPHQGKYLVLLAFSLVNDVWQAQATSSNGKTKTWQYDACQGLVEVKD